MWNANRPQSGRLWLAPVRFVSVNMGGHPTQTIAHITVDLYFDWERRARIQLIASGILAGRARPRATSGGAY